jgi:hypothetical protein
MVKWVIQSWTLKYWCGKNNIQALTRITKSIEDGDLFENKL